MATEFSLKWFRAKLESAIKSAGPRYTPEVNVDLPIGSIFDAMGKTEAFFSRLRTFREDCIKIQSEDIPRRLLEHRVITKRTATKLAKNIERLSRTLTIRSPSTASRINYARVGQLAGLLTKELGGINNCLHDKLIQAKPKRQEEPKQSSGLSQEDRLNFLMHAVRETHRQLDAIRIFAESDEAALFNDPVLLLIGPVGVGKTHLLCDIARLRLKRGWPTVLVLANQLPPVRDPLSAIAHKLGSGHSGRAFLRRLAALGRKQKRRVLIFIDAINEGDRKSWRKSLRGFIGEIRKYPAVGVALSCRTPFDKVTVPSGVTATRVAHHGFSEYEFEAMKIYFSHYKLPFPEVPVLVPEFSSPLFLKLFCESLKGALHQEKHRRIKEISAGQEGMLNVFEDWVMRRAKKIAGRLSFEPKAVWGVLKDGVAPVMAENRRSWLTLSELKGVLKTVCANDRYRVRFISALVREHLLSEDVVYDPIQRKYLEVVRLPYQKFSDHLVARHLLRKFLDRGRPENSFKGSSPLSGLFKDEQTIFEEAGVIEALIIEFPVWTGNRGELFDYLPQQIPFKLAELFISGLYWRKPKGFSRSTDRWVVTLLANEFFKDKTFDVLVGLAVKPSHPYNAIRLDRYLRKLAMPKRDVLWSEFLRKSYPGQAVYRVLEWIETTSHDVVQEDYARMLMQLLCWYLTCTKRSLRDRATRCLYLLGKKHPRTLFDLTINSLTVNDPYVPERTLAASYGVAMGLHQNSDHQNLVKKALFEYAQKLYTLMFAQKAPFSTTHVLMRDYAKRTVEVASHRNPHLLNARQRRRITPPFKDGGIRRWGRSTDSRLHQNGSPPIQLDFRNYTVGRLVPARHNYDDAHPEYKIVLQNVYWRLYGLGWTHDVFGKIDREIAFGSRDRLEKNDTRVDRYGKKYSWIAYFELYGHRQDKGLLKRDWGDGSLRPSDTDIDPSFPVPSRAPKLVTTNFIRHPSRSLRSWVTSGAVPDFSPYLVMQRIGDMVGPWVLLNGYVNQEQATKRRCRGCFMFIRGFMIDDRFSTEVLRYLTRRNFRNERFPEVPTDHYVFQGEIPWCDTFLPNGETDIEFEAEQKKKFPITIPARNINCSWSHSAVIPEHSGSVPAREISESLGLWVQPQTWDMFDPSGARASIIISWGEPWSTRQDLLYLRQDMLNGFLTQRKKSLIWALWGERVARPGKSETFRGWGDRVPPYKTFQRIYRYQRQIGKSLGRVPVVAVPAIV